MKQISKLKAWGFINKQERDLERKQVTKQFYFARKNLWRNSTTFDRVADLLHKHRPEINPNKNEIFEEFCYDSEEEAVIIKIDDNNEIYLSGIISNDSDSLEHEIKSLQKEMDENFCKVNDKLNSITSSIKTMMSMYSHKLNLVTKMIQLRAKSEEISNSELDDTQN